jgi:type I restriction-modification system DNA methylase subunit
MSHINYDLLKKIVWNFADLLRDKGHGSTEDYARITIPTLAIKRILDLKDEYLHEYVKDSEDELQVGLIDIQSVLENINNKLHFYNLSDLKETPNQYNVVLLSWKNLMDYEENENGEKRTISLSYNQAYHTQAKNFVELMFEIIKTFEPLLVMVFNDFDFQRLLLEKQVVPYSDFYKICHGTIYNEVTQKKETHEYSLYSLSQYTFSNANISSDIFGDVYMDLIGRFAHDSGKKGGEFFTPTPLVENGIHFLALDEFVAKMKHGVISNLKIGDPTAGSNTFLMYAKKELDALAHKMNYDLPVDNLYFFAQELKSFQGSLGALNIVFHGLSHQFNTGITLKNYISNVITNYHQGIGQQSGKLDIVLANPPYGTKDYGIDYANQNKTENRFKYGIPNKSDGEYAFLLTVLDLLNSTGRALVVLPLGTLFRDASSHIRKQFLTEDVVEGLVTLPGNMFLTTQIPVVLWILNKAKKESDKGKVFMVNASQDFKKIGKFNEWQTTKSIDNYLSRAIEEDYSGYVDFETLEKNKFNFSVQRYFSKVKEKEEIDIAQLEKDIILIEDSISKQKKDMNSIISQILSLKEGKIDE